MNLEQMLTKLKALEEGSQMAPPSMPAAECGDMPTGDQLLVGDTEMEECGMDMMPPAPKQSDSVTMNVSMNGSGKGGIRDLMDILRNIEDAAGGGDDAKDIMIGMADGADMLDIDAAESFANPMDPDTYEIDDVVNPPSNDLASNHGDHRMRQTGLPRAHMESLVDKLALRYQEIKEESHQSKTTMKHIKDPTEGEKKAAKDIKAGTKGYKDRIDMLKSAEKEGRLKD
jgi:hypothetical protein